MTILLWLSLADKSATCTFPSAAYHADYVPSNTVHNVHARVSFERRPYIAFHHGRSSRSARPLRRSDTQYTNQPTRTHASEPIAASAASENEQR